MLHTCGSANREARENCGQCRSLRHWRRPKHRQADRAGDPSPGQEIAIRRRLEDAFSFESDLQDACGDD